MQQESHSAATAPVSAGVEPGELDLSGMARAVKKRKSWVFGGTLAAFIAGLAFVSLVKPHYTANTQVLIENQDNFYTQPIGAAPSSNQPPDDAAVASQIQLVTSRDLARQAIAALKLQNDPEFNPQAKKGLFGRLESLLGLGRASSSLSEEDLILQNYYARLSVFQVQKSRVLEIDFTSQDPKLAAKAANTIADLYTSTQIAAKRQVAKAAAATLGPQVVKLQNALAAAEDKAESFRASTGLLAGPNNTPLNAQALADLNAKLAAARSAEADASAKARLIRDALNKGRLDEISDIANNQLVRQIALQRVNLRAQLALESRTLLPEHPQIKELKAQLADLDQQLRAAAVTAARGFENDARLAKDQFDSVKQTLDQQKRMVGNSGADQVRLRTLERTAKAISDQLEATMTKYQDALAQESAVTGPGDARVISKAIAPRLPSFPRVAPTLIFAALAGLVLSVAAALAAELLSMGERNFDESAPEVVGPTGFEPGRKRDVSVEFVSDEPPGFAALRRDFEERAKRFESQAERKPALEPSDDLRETIAQASALSRASGKAACLLVLGAGDEAPAGMTAVEIGRRLALEGRTIVIELSRNLLAQARLEGWDSAKPGFGELSDGGKSFAEVIERDARTRLHFIGAGLLPIQSGEAFDIALEALGETYDHVILLAAPLDRAPLTRDVAGAADVVIIVAPEAGENAQVEAIRTELARCGAGLTLAIVRSIPPEPAPEHVSAA